MATPGENIFTAPVLLTENDIPGKVAFVHQSGNEKTQKILVKGWEVCTTILFLQV